MSPDIDRCPDCGGWPQDICPDGKRVCTCGATCPDCGLYTHEWYEANGHLYDNITPLDCCDCAAEEPAWDFDYDERDEPEAA